MEWFNYYWPWIGLFFGLTILALLIATNKLTENKDIPKYYDLSWLAWAIAFTFFMHNFEEYGIDLLGRHHHFPEEFREKLHTDTTLGGNPPADFFTAVNLSGVWFAGTCAALLSHKFPLVGFALLGLMFLDGLSHVAAFLIEHFNYNSGLLTACTLFLPLTYWIITKCFGNGKTFSYHFLKALMGIGFFTVFVLLGSAQLFLHGYINGTILVLIQILNGLFLIYNTWFAKEKLGEKVYGS